MNEQKLKELLCKVQSGKVSVDVAVDNLKNLPYKDLEYAKLDYHRLIRQGLPEVIYCKEKTDEQVIGIARALLLDKKSPILATRITKDCAAKLTKIDSRFRYNEIGRTVFLVDDDGPNKKGNILIVAAGTSDLPVVEEAFVTSFVLGNHVHKLVDVGVAGIHRLFAHKHLLDAARVIIVVAGMDGALASVVGGLVNKAVIAVPTSVGYGSSFNGLSALLSMLNSCSPNVVTVNIDNGFGGAYAASLINKM